MIIALIIMSIVAAFLLATSLIGYGMMISYSDYDSFYMRIIERLKKHINDNDLAMFYKTKINEMQEEGN